MNDPHVVTLHYKIETGPGISYKDPEPMGFTNGLGEFKLAEGELVFYPREHFPSEVAAKAALEPFLRAWEMDADLTRNIGQIRFAFNRAEVIDRQPGITGKLHRLSVSVGGVVLVGGEVTFHLTSKKYPDPPSEFRSTPEAELAYRRWIAFREKREPLQSMAYFVFTLVTGSSGTVKAAASAYDIDIDVLRTVARLSSTKGDPATARKAPAAGVFDSLTGSESAWLEAAIRKIVRRIGERASGAPLQRIGMSDLPTLS